MGFLRMDLSHRSVSNAASSAIQDGQARAVNRQLKYLLGKNYYRFDYRLEKGRGSDKLDDASRRNINRLTRGATEMVEEMRPQLRALAKTLTPVNSPPRKT